MDRLSSLSSLKKQRSLWISTADVDDEHRPILLGNPHRHDASPSSSNENSPVMRRSSSLIHNNNNNNPHDGDSGEVIVKIDRDSNQSGDILHDDGSGEFEFQHNGSKDVAEDPPSRLIGQFLNKQRAAGGEICLDMDMGMDELRDSNSGACACSPVSFPPHEPYFSNRYNSNRISASRDLKVQFIEEHSGDSTPPNSRVVDIALDHHQQNHSPSSSLSSSSDDDNDEEMMEPPQQQRSRRRTSGSMTFSFNNNNNVVEGSKGGDGHVVKCTSFQRRGSFMAGRRMINKTKSRLMDDIVVVPDVVVSEKKSGRIFGKSSVQTMRSSGLMMGKSPEEEEDDPLLDDFDIPEEFKSSKIDALTLAQWISLVVIVTSLVCTLCFPSLKAYRMRGLRLWKWEVLILVLICGRLVSGWAIRVAVFFIERNFLLRKRLLYFVYGVRKAVQNCMWLGLVLIAWHSMFDKKVEGNNDFLRSVNKIMVCMLIGITLWLLKTLMVKVLASSFHVSKFFDRIQESLFNQYIIEALSGPPLNEIHSQQEEEDRAMAEVWKLQDAGAKLPPELKASAFKHLKSNNNFSRVVDHGGGGGGATPTRISGIISTRSVAEETEEQHHHQGITIDFLHKLNPRNISAWNMKRLVKMVRHGVLSTLDEQIHCTAQKYEANQIRSECEAKLAARKIFHNVAKPKSNSIYLDDLRRFLRQEEAVQAMNLLGGSRDCRRIRKVSLKNWVVNVFRERRALALTLDDTKTAVKKLHQMVTVLVAVIIFLISLVILGFVTGRDLMYISSQVVIVTFIFGNQCKNVFEAIIFLFVMHPFDVGDRCEVDGVEMVVEEMNILTTVFLRYDNLKVHFPNSTLAMRPIGNFYRSPDMGDSVDFLVHIATPMDKIKGMNQRIVNFVESKKEHWYSSPMVVLMNIEDMNKLKMSVWLRHKMNFQDMGERWLRRAQLVDEMVKIFKEMDIDYRLYPVDINVRAMPTIQSTRHPPKWQPPSIPDPSV
ncbi:hypothetical protein DM860_000998 [Cuscuta australis]|uniref:Mechanosensitive ion channel protein n=1 Tax=Cuscuta australis TaxID=267555 RepID=A0A328DW07_9ASTE|nr:hypothetical protein DM860_000998 [Cuscuta australis]